MLSRYGSVLSLYLFSRLVIVLGFYFVPFLVAVVVRDEALLASLYVRSFRWLSGEAEVALPLPSPGTVALAFHAWPVQANLPVQVSIAGEAVQTLTLLEGVREYQILLPLAALEAARQTGLPLRVVFRSAAYSPRELTHSVSPDRRLLALSLTYLSYVPADPSRPLRVGDDSLFVRGAFAVERDMNVRRLLQSALFRWDANWYRTIVNTGYTYQAGGGSEQATRFFPLYPLLCWSLGRVVPASPDLLLWGVANLAALVAVFLFADLARETVGAEAAWGAIVLFCLWPGSLFFFLPYSESLMALLTVLFLRSLQRHAFPWAAAVAGLATACRPTGVAFVPALAWMYCTRSSVRPFTLKHLLGGIGLLAVSVSGLAAYAVYLHWRFDDALAFARPQIAVGRLSGNKLWERLLGTPLWQPLLQALWHDPLSLFVVPAVVNRGAVVVALVLFFTMRRRLGPAWLIVGVSLLLVPYGLLGPHSMTRYLAVNIPWFFCGGLLLTQERLRHWLPGLAALLALVLFIFAALFATGEYFVG